jgi:hypothetical protein
MSHHLAAHDQVRQVLMSPAIAPLADTVSAVTFPAGGRRA